MAYNPHSYLKKAALAMEGVKGIDAAGELDIAELDAGTVNVAADTFAFNDADDGQSYEEAIADLVAAVAGDGIAAAAGVMSIDLDELGDEAIDVAADTIAFIDEGTAGDPSKLESVADFVTAIAGTGLAATSGVLSIEANEVAAETIDVAADTFLFVDEGTVGDPTKKESIADLMTAVAGTAANTALAATTGVLAVAPADAALTVNADSLVFMTAAGVPKKDLVSDVATAMAGDGMAAAAGVLALDLNGLTGEVIDPAADSLAFLDATDASNKKESVKDLVALIAAGGGLAAANGVMSLDLNDLGDATIDVAADTIAFIDENAAGDPSKLESVVDLVAGIASTGLVASAGTLAVDLDGLGDEAIDVAADSIAFVDEGTGDDPSKLESVADLMTAVAGEGLIATAGVLSVDLDELGDEAIDAAADTIVFIDEGTEGDPTKLESVADLVAAIAGVGLTAASGVMATEDPGAIAVGSVLFGATGDCTSVSVGAVTYAHDETPVVADGEWAYGASASESATNFAAAINGKTDSPYTAIADGDTVYIFAEVVGTAGNVLIARTGGAQPATLENLVGGLAAATKQSCVVRHVVTANEVDTAVLVHIPVPFTPTKFIASVTSATGQQKILTDLFTIAASPDRIVLTGDGATHAIATDIITVQAWE